MPPAPSLVSQLAAPLPPPDPPLPPPPQSIPVTHSPSPHPPSPQPSPPIHNPPLLSSPAAYQPLPPSSSATIAPSSAQDAPFAHPAAFDGQAHLHPHSHSYTHPYPHSVQPSQNPAPQPQGIVHQHHHLSDPHRTASIDSVLSTASSLNSSSISVNDHPLHHHTLIKQHNQHILDSVESAPPQLRFPHLPNHYPPDFLVSPPASSPSGPQQSNFRQRSTSVFAAWPFHPAGATTATTAVASSAPNSAPPISCAPSFGGIAPMNQFNPLGITMPSGPLSPLHAAAAAHAAATAATDQHHHQQQYPQQHQKQPLDFTSADLQYGHPSNHLETYQQHQHHQHPQPQQQHYQQQQQHQNPHFYPHQQHSHQQYYHQQQQQHHHQQQQQRLEQLLMQSVQMQFSRERSMSLPVIQSQFAAAAAATGFISPLSHPQTDSPYVLHPSQQTHRLSPMGDGVNLLDTALDAMAIAPGHNNTPVNPDENAQNVFIKLPPVGYALNFGPHGAHHTSPAAALAAKSASAAIIAEMDANANRRGSAGSSIIGRNESNDEDEETAYDAGYDEGDMDGDMNANGDVKLARPPRRRSLPTVPIVVASAAAAAAAAAGAPSGTFACTHPTCGRLFTRIQNLRSHARCHLIDAPHVCPSCGLGFRRSTDLHRHVRTMHTPADQKPWACTKCGKRFGRSDALRRHQQSRSKMHACPAIIAPDPAPVVQAPRSMQSILQSERMKQVHNHVDLAEFNSSHPVSHQLHGSNASLMSSAPEFHTQL